VTEEATAEITAEIPAATFTLLPSETASAIAPPTLTESPTLALTAPPTLTESPTLAPTATQTAAVAIVLPTPVSALPETTPPPAPRLPLEALVGAALLALVIGYVALYWRGLAAGDRYADGFVIDRCPVCKHGHLSVETRQSRLLGIPRQRYTVRCNTCRSVLREAGSRRWRYAVDASENPLIYNRFNGRMIDEATLKALEQEAPLEPPPVRPPTKPPAFVDEEE
ncbi:MAG: hypothetical protein ABI835_07055, partial [Chloroflexota bacterium]